jgi:hypothetical protein
MIPTMTMRTKETATLAHTIIKEYDMSENDSSENDSSEFMTDWHLEPPQRRQRREKHRLAVGGNGGYDRTAFYVTTDMENGNDAQNRAAVFGFDLQIRFPHEGLPTAGAALLVGLDELVLDAHGRREYLARLLTQNPPMPTVLLSRDFLLDPRTVVRPGLMLAARLDDDVFRALRDGHINLPAEGREGRKAA